MIVWLCGCMHVLQHTLSVFFVVLSVPSLGRHKGPGDPGGGRHKGPGYPGGVETQGDWSSMEAWGV